MTATQILSTSAPSRTCQISASLATAYDLSNVMRELAAATYADGGFPHREMDLLQEAGFFAITLPGEALDMTGPNTATLLQLLKLVGRGNLSVGRIYEGHVNALLLLHLYGTPRQRQTYYADARAGHLFGVWNTEMRDGVHLHQDEAGDGARVQGSKSFCSGSTQVTRPIVPGVLHGPDGESRGWQMSIVHLDEHELPVDESFWSPLGMRNSVSHKIDFSGQQLTGHQLLGKPDEYEIQPHFSGGAIRFAAVHLGAAEALLDETRNFLRKVGREDDPYQRTRVGQMAIACETGNLWLDRSGQLNDNSKDSDAIVASANMTRTAIAEICLDCLQLAERSVGARGLLHPSPFARLHTDLSMYLRQPAPDATLEMVGQYYLNQHDDFHQLRTHEA
ncbi:acyl-CoA dehydrogenase family protein [Neolewinella antarctica]|uniref:Alkylation response protein AidB-like acyl-CoA dehydrogenase n=1 Tax=Neolewinella antarctica TaxID=442734 RepID=A0ABX0XCQ7_9BACT|nr:acyl-CoA dehydrogenase family protein [Neolewinella antarctica]NJC26855.1 alkylation response protein AidB-like acyl-CoA dehydrogenase [Neolewinella antarctica]